MQKAIATSVLRTRYIILIIKAQRLSIIKRYRSQPSRARSVGPNRRMLGEPEAGSAQCKSVDAHPKERYRQTER